MKKSQNKPKVSLIIACFNERKIISDCLDSILQQDYPKDKMEIFVVDGMSDDGTRELLKKYAENYSNLEILDNKNRIQPHAFNMGIKASSGEYIFIMGAHNKYPQNYVFKCVEYMMKENVDNVGGRIEAKTDKNDIISKAIIGSYTSSFGIGNATFRKKIEEPTLVDTVFGGCYRRDVFDRVGFYNETLKRSQDMELNLRLVRSGGKILLAPDIFSYYYPKTGFLEFIKYNFKAGKGPIRAMRITGKPLKLMHYIPAMFVLGILLGPLILVFEFTKSLIWLYFLVLSLYALLAIIYSFSYALRHKRINLIFFMPIIFIIKHLTYGLGSLFGIFKLHD